VPRQRIAGGRAISYEAALLNLATLGAIFGRLGIWERRVLLLAAVGDLSLAAIVEECARRWPWRTQAWTLYRVRSDLRDARSRLEDLLRRRGMLET
jgi:hypothetical protein